MWQLGLINFKKTFLSLLIISAIFLLWPNRAVRASINENIRGWAYNSSYGYISMNCLDDSFAGRFTFTFPFAFYILPCTMSQHGVNLDDNNNFSGQAWNSILGFINFSGATAPDYLFEASCPSACNIGNNCTACYNEVTQKVYGWARVVNSGIWIKLDDNTVPPTTGITNYAAATPGIFSGYASSTLGAISFNCTNDSSCGANPYEVKIGPLEIRQLIAPNWSAQDVCDSRVTNKAVLSWNKRSGQQSAYQVIVNTSNSTTSPIYDSGKATSSVINQAVVTGLNLDVSYYWFLRLWDAVGSSTPWRQFNTSGSGLIKDRLTENSARNTQKNLVDPSKTFTTYKHDFPLAYFTFNSVDVAIGTSTPFNGIVSSYYNDSNQLKPCSGGICFYQWSVIGDNRAVINSTTTASTTIVFARATSTTVKLEVTDDAPYTCSTSTVLNVNYALPLWKEIKPIN